MRGQPPWPDRACTARWSRFVLVAASSVALASATTVCVTPVGRAALVPITAAAAAAVLAMGAVAARQWRFVPARRRVEAVLLVTAAGGVVIGYPALAADPWSVAVIAAAVVLGVATAWPTARLLAASKPGRPAVDIQGLPAP